MIYEELCPALFAVHQPVMPVLWLCKGHSNPGSHTQRFMNNPNPYLLYHLSIKCHKIIVIL